MKKKKVICLSILIVLSIVVTTLIIVTTNKNDKTFYLENNYYGTNNMTEINRDELDQLIENKKSFAVFVYQPMCVTSSDFESILSNFLKDKQISVYKIAFSNIKDTNIGKYVKYYPSFIIYKKGKMIDFLEADKDDNVKYYTSKKGFGNWFTKYVKLKNPSSRKTKSSSDKTEKEENTVLKDVTLKNVVKEDNKVNIYFFWGNGCPHCEKEIELFKSIKENYGDYYNLYTFETWYHEENAKLIYTFADAMGDKIKGVPYTIIGNESFNGFSETVKNDMISAIENQHKNSYDVYLDKIKK